MIIQVVGNTDINGLSRALDRFLLFLIEEDVQEVRNFFISADLWNGSERLEAIGDNGRPYPINLEPYPDRRSWEAVGDVQPRLIRVEVESASREHNAAPAERATVIRKPRRARTASKSS